LACMFESLLRTWLFDLTNGILAPTVKVPECVSSSFLFGRYFDISSFWVWLLFFALVIPGSVCFVWVISSMQPAKELEFDSFAVVV